MYTIAQSHFRPLALTHHHMYMYHHLYNQPPPLLYDYTNYQKLTPFHKLPALIY